MDQLPNELYWKILLYSDISGLRKTVCQIDRRSLETVFNPQFWYQWLQIHKPKLLRFSDQLESVNQLASLIKASEGDEDAKPVDLLLAYMEMREMQRILKKMIDVYVSDKGNRVLTFGLNKLQVEELGYSYNITYTYVLFFVLFAIVDTSKFYLTARDTANEGRPKLFRINMDFSRVMYLLAVDQADPIKYWERRLSGLNP